ncbi:MAG TPA: hypothetical protein VGT02_06125 [Methylomirabilota bacterium]|jgi:hypothetical protein|nr:hypothetical protein [Methylomirabilota bacterium]
MRQQSLLMGLGILSSAAAVSAAVVAAAGLTEQLQASRMTVLKTDPAAGRFQCAEHLSWTAVHKSDLDRVRSGDIVRVVKHSGEPARLVLLRTAADEIATPER